MPSLGNLLAKANSIQQKRSSSHPTKHDCLHSCHSASPIYIICEYWKGGSLCGWACAQTPYSIHDRARTANRPRYLSFAWVHSVSISMRKYADPSLDTQSSTTKDACTVPAYINKINDKIPFTAAWIVFVTSVNCSGQICVSDTETVRAGHKPHLGNHFRLLTTKCHGSAWIE